MAKVEGKREVVSADAITAIMCFIDAVMDCVGGKIFSEVKNLNGVEYIALFIRNEGSYSISIAPFKESNDTNRN